MQSYGEHSNSRVNAKSGQDLELKDVIISEQLNSSSDSSETEADPNDSEDTTQRRREALLAGLYQKLSAVQWRKAFTLFVVVISCFLVNGSTSLIATFFPTEVMLIFKFFDCA